MEVSTYKGALTTNVIYQFWSCVASINFYHSSYFQFKIFLNQLALFIQL